ncbi:MAG: MFS transporter [Myxococcota bacterium]
MTEAPSPAAGASAPAKLSFQEKVGYGLGDTASHFVWDMVGTWALIFYTDVYGIDPGVAALILLVARLWDMVTDPVMGVIADRTNTRWGKFRPYLLWMAIPYGVLAVMTFSTPELSDTGKAIYAGVTYMALMTVYTAINLPYSSLAGVMTGSSDERAVLNQYRFVGAFAGQLVVTGSALTLVSKLGNGNEAAGYQTTMILFGIVSVVFFLGCFALTRERIEPPKGQKPDLKADLKNVLETRPWIVLVAVGIVSFTLFAMQANVAAFYFKYYVSPDAHLELLRFPDSNWGILQFISNLSENEKFNIVGTVAIIVALPLAKPLASRFGNRNVYIGCSILTALFNGLMFIPGPDQLGLIHIINVLGKMSFAPTAPLLWTMIANTADFSEWKKNRRATGLFFSASTLSMKLGWGLGGYLSAYLLGVFGYVANQDQSDEALMGIRLMMTAIPAALFLVAGVLLLFYELDLKTVTTMQAELKARRAAAQAAEDAEPSTF